MTRSILTVALLSGCGGAMLDLSRADPGGDVSLEQGATPRVADDGTWSSVGSIGVDPVSEDAWIVRSKGITEEQETQKDDGSTSMDTVFITESRAVFAVSAEGEKRISELPVDIEDLRVTFPHAGPLLFGELAGQEVRARLDRTTLAPVATATTDHWSWGTRTSPSGDWVVVADNTAEHYPLHLLDPQDLSTLVIPHGGDWLEGGWLPGHDDLLVAASFTSPHREQGQTLDDLDPASWGLTWQTWDLRDPAIAEAAHAGGALPDPSTAVHLPGVTAEHLIGMSWVTGAPDGRTAAVPVNVWKTVGEKEWSVPGVAVLDLETGTTRVEADLRGPVAFTPDSTTLVGWDFRDEDSEIVLVDLATAERQVLPMPHSLPEYALVGDGHLLIVQPAPYMAGPMLLHDLDTGSATTLPSDGPDRMDTWVHRPDRDEIWAVDRTSSKRGNGLFRIDLGTERLTVIDIPISVEQINHLRARDQLVLAGNDSTPFGTGPWLGWMGMDDAQMTGLVSLNEGTPFDALGLAP